MGSAAIRTGAQFLQEAVTTSSSTVSSEVDFGVLVLVGGVRVVEATFTGRFLAGCATVGFRPLFTEAFGFWVLVGKVARLVWWDEAGLLLFS